MPTGLTTEMTNDLPQDSSSLLEVEPSLGVARSSKLSLFRAQRLNTRVQLWLGSFDRVVVEDCMQQTVNLRKKVYGLFASKSTKEVKIGSIS